MSERFVRGWSVDANELQELVGGKAQVKQILASAKKSAPSVFLALGQGDKKRGAALTNEALSDIVTGTLRKEMGQRYARMTELCLSHAGTMLKGEIPLVLTNYLPNRTDPSWRPVLKALGLPKLAAVWAAPNMLFPWPKKGASSSEWPIRMQVSAKQLVPIARELAATGDKAIGALPPSSLVRDDQQRWLKATQDELAKGMKTLQAWVKAVAPGEDLVLIIDGDQ